MCEDEQEQRVRKELEAHYFRSDLIVFKNFNMFRSSDLFMVITMMYISMQLFFDLHPAVYFAYVQAAVVCASDPFGMLTSVHVHICVWCVIVDKRFFGDVSIALALATSCTVKAAIMTLCVRISSVEAPCKMRLITGKSTCRPVQSKCECSHQAKCTSAAQYLLMCRL
jgi:hypothetical protein